MFDTLIRMTYLYALILSSSDRLSMFEGQG